MPCCAQIWWIRAVPNICVLCPYDPCRAKYFRAALCLVPRCWVQDLGTKKKRRAREAEPLGMPGGTGGGRPPARGSGGLEAPQEQQGVWGAAAPQ